MRALIFLLFLSNPLIYRAQNQYVDTLKVTSDSLREIEEVTVTGSRTAQLKKNSVVSVSTLDQKLFQAISATSISDALKFSPGIRMETNCQTCNYTQVRMNGLGGSYSQILINGRPLFSSLMGLYGLEQIPTNIVDRIEVVNGGGSVLYGSNAIAGTINIITKHPEYNFIEISDKVSLVPKGPIEQVIQLNGGMVTKSKKSGFLFSGMNKVRDGYDRNGDGFTEIPRVNSSLLGINAFQNIGKSIELHADFWILHEQRQGGQLWNGDPQQAEQSEFRNQITSIGQFSGNWKSRNTKWNLQAYTGFQKTNRHHYTGLNHVEAWGKTNNVTWQSGLQFNFTQKIGAKSKFLLIGGLEHYHDDIQDSIRGYDYYINQQIMQVAGFLQSQLDLGQKWSFVAGIRITKHSKVDNLIITPRAALLFKPNGQWQLRLSYGNGFKAPQVFETDMHIAFANGGISQIQVDPNLKSEKSHAYSAQANWSRRRKKMLYSSETVFFHTQLLHSFVLNEIPSVDPSKTMLLRTNGSNAEVTDFSESVRLKWDKFLQVDVNFTYQESRFTEAQQWSLDVEPIKAFLRTPNVYGSSTISIFPEGKWSGSINGVFTGKMLVPHFGGAPELDHDEIVHTKSFWDLGIRAERSIHIHKMEQTIRIGLGIQNLFDSYQSDFDTSKLRDSNFVYGPSRPRTIFVDIKWVIGGKH
ncbi:TonB-dependent receptor plug domain-containing protein [Fluviicola taffensis]|uniref:TonB-dependent receptor plug n=1 Tax=Fluviicola taffensis (strain DSM 16823 / NCIMB 13979 / RW262) TaxID=755732 RepID=F2IIQ1_FLUTR|nr:TonB-dependent receptor [Fluviicola taffensis]AEA46013.1 TonB-dependent receptor plug [Fluviicola taffensis DSM 16823]